MFIDTHYLQRDSRTDNLEDQSTLVQVRKELSSTQFRSKGTGRLTAQSSSGPHGLSDAEFSVSLRRCRKSRNGCYKNDHWTFFPDPTICPCL
ncbi:hypothetical protein TNCV_3117711 [Trichonephila clavipes]|uniref:Uncharacterized protein n=1 Tax=Trichonephila clavipes TaxID=2585209 RepID=A0A8X6W9C7_TRICX|nr:hypothetical protein TNCV_3117711 [Trichonephila clavipes]